MQEDCGVGESADCQSLSKRILLQPSWPPAASSCPQYCVAAGVVRKRAERVLRLPEAPDSTVLQPRSTRSGQRRTGSPLAPGIEACDLKSEKLPPLIPF